VPDGEWLATPGFTDLTNEYITKMVTLGASRNAAVYVFHGANGVPFIASDTSSLYEECQGAGRECGGIYAVTGIGTQAPALHLVNVDSDGNMIGPESINSVGALPASNSKVLAYQAISADGSTIFFTATPKGGVDTLYARRDYAETVTISAPECEGNRCSSPVRSSSCPRTPMKVGICMNMTSGAPLATSCVKYPVAV
jgi:hypothetical protein